MGLSMPGWESGEHDLVAEHLGEGVRVVADAGADFFICPDNTAHIVLEKVIDQLPIPGLHIAQVVCREIEANGWRQVGLLGTEWTMTGPVYPAALAARGMEMLVPKEPVRRQIDSAIFDELCMGIFRPETTEVFLDAIRDLKERGAQCVILGCTEIPLIVTPENSSLPTLDSPRLLARHAVRVAVDDEPLPTSGWIPL